MRHWWVMLWLGALSGALGCSDETPGSVTPPPMMDEEPACEGGDCPPEITFKAPQDNAGLSGPTRIEVEATDDLGLERVEILVDGELLAEGQSGALRATWETSGFAEGPHTLKATATDSGAQSAEVSIEVLVDRTPPQVSLLQPTDGQIVHDAVDCEAEIIDNLGAAEFRCGVVGQGASARTEAPPWLVSVDVSALAAGEYTLLATGKDRAGGSDQDARTIVIDRPPTLSFVSPVAQELIRRQLVVEIAVDDDHGVESASLFVDGEPVGDFDGDNQAVWTPSAGTGTAVLRAVAVDSLGQEGAVELEVAYEIDPCDVDGDSFRGDLEGCGGDDCQDDDPSIFPGAPDEVFDDVDQNCDGIDGVDFDRDEVASIDSGGLDCDDEDPEIYPCPFDPPGICADRQTNRLNCGECGLTCDIALACVGAECLCDAEDCLEGEPEEYDFDVAGTYVTAIRVVVDDEDGLDLDNDGTPDNAFGPVIDALSLLLGGGLNRELQIQIAQGTLALGITWPTLARGAPIADAEGVEVDILSLVDADDDLETRDRWLATRGSFLPGYVTPRSRFRSGTLAAGRLNAGPADHFFMVLPFGEVSLTMIVTNALLAGTVTRDGQGARLGGGTLGGQLTLEDLIASVNDYLLSETCECLGLEGPMLDLRVGQGPEACVGEFTASNCGDQGICATLARNCRIFMNLLIPNMDLDTDGDGDFDAFSAFLRLSGQGAVIEGLEAE